MGLQVQPRVRSLIWERDKGICQICWQPVPFDRTMNADHIVPVIRGGCSHEENLRTTHRLCNVRRKDHGPAVSHCPLLPYQRRAQSNDPDALIRMSIQITREQEAWLQSLSRERGRQSLAAIVRQVVQAAMEAGQQNESAAR